MSNQLQMKAATLAQILADNSLTKEAGQTITHKSVYSQDNLGKEQEADLKDNVVGIEASVNTPSNKVQETPGVQSLNKEPQAALAATGTSVNTMASDGSAAGTPAAQVKSASEYRADLAKLIKTMNKKATDMNARTHNANDFRTGTEVMEKFASLTPYSTQADLASAQEDLVKLASSNPAFNICRERILMSKMAEDIAVLAEQEGISPEVAAQELQAAAEMAPEMAAEMEDEATIEAVEELAAAEEETNALMQGVQAMADNASNALGTQVTPDDIIAAADETAALAAEMGVPPEALIEQAMLEMQGGAGAEDDITPEEAAEAQYILEEAAANGISPEEVIQIAAEELQAGESAPVEKVASLQKRAGSNRVAFTRELRSRF